MAFKITKSDLQFHKKMNLPLPNKCPNCRHGERFSRHNPLRFWHRQCMCKQENHGHDARCINEFETSYSLEQPEIIYCEKCYQKEIY